MNRKEFCELLVKARKESGVKMKDICKILDIMPTSIYNIERGTTNFNISFAIKYMTTFGCKIILRSEGVKKRIEISDYHDFLNLLKTLKKTYTERELAALIDGSNAIIGAIIRRTHTASIDTFLKLMEAMKYTIELEMSDTTAHTSSTYVEITKSIFESNTEHVAINITKNIFSDLLASPKWYEKHPSLYRQKGQYIKKKFLDNQLKLEEMIDILVNSGYIYSLRITSPDSGTIFSDHLTAYNILSKIYNVHTILGIRNISDYMIKTASDKHLSIDFILQFLIKVGCEIDIKWEIPEIVYV